MSQKGLYLDNLKKGEILEQIFETPILVSNCRNGRKKYWKGIVVLENSRYFRQAETWRETINGGESKHIISEPYEINPKNVGRVNETTARDQALREMDAIVRKMHDKGFVKPGEKRTILPQPMLAKKYVDEKESVNWTKVFVQPKYNGMRMMYDGKVGWSRGGKPIIPKVIAHLQFNIDEGVIVDGELLLPHMPVLQETIRAAKKYRKGVSDKLIYVIYDIVDPNLPFSQRAEIYRSIVEKANNPQVVAAPCFSVQNEKEMIRRHDSFVNNGFEGTILRVDGDGYEMGHRSEQLLKFKNFRDSEFNIVDVTHGKGKFRKCAIFVCETKDRVQFNCAPEGEMEYRKELYRTRKNHIGKWLTVRYFELTKDGVPQFPVAVSIREGGEF